MLSRACPPRVVAIVPAFSEELNLPPLLAALRGAARCDVCVVDDGSAERTAAVARQAGVAVLRAPFNLGLGATVQTGYLRAHAHGHDGRQPGASP